MKNLILSLFLFSTASSFAFQLPVQQSADIATQIIKHVLSNNSLAYRSITKINISNDFAKVELTDNKGECLAIPFVVSYSRVGELSVEVDKLALAICN